VAHGWDGEASDGWEHLEYTTALDSPNTGYYVPATTFTNAGFTYGLSTRDGIVPQDCTFVLTGPENHEIWITTQAFSPIIGTFNLNLDCGLQDENYKCFSMYVYDAKSGTPKEGGFALPEEKDGGYIFYDHTTGRIIHSFSWENPETQRCVVDDDGDGVWDLMEAPTKTTGTFDQDQGRALLMKKTVYDSKEHELASYEYEYSTDPTTAFGGDFIKSAWPPLDSETITVDGVRMVKTIEYNQLNGLPNKIEEEGSGKKRITTKTYAYVENTPMQIDEHMWSQEQLTTIYDTSETNANIRYMSENIYSNDFYDNSDRQWFVYESRIGYDDDRVVSARNIDFDDFGHVIHQEDGDGAKTYFYYGANDECGNSDVLANAYLTCIENEYTHQTKMSYDEHGKKSAATDPNEVQTSWEYDDLGRLELKSRDGVVQEQYEYYLAGEDLSESNLNTNTKTTRFDSTTDNVYVEHLDGLGRAILHVIESEDGDLVTELEYDGAGMLKSNSEQYRIRPSSMRKQNYDYEDSPLKRELSSTMMGSQLPVTKTYSSHTLYDRYEIVTDEDDNEERYTFDAFGNLISVRNGLLIQTDYDYSVIGKITAVDIASTEVSSYDYNTRNLLETVSSPDRNDISFTYNSRGQKDTMTNGRGQEVEYLYDDAGRIDLIDNPDSEDIDYTYDQSGRNGIGKLTTVEDSSGRTSFYYDSLGRLARETIRVDGRNYNVEYEYDDYDQLKKQKIDGNDWIYYDINEEGRLTQVRYHGQVITMDYEDAGEIKTVDFPNGVTTDYYYNDRGWVSAINVHDDESLFARTYQYDETNQDTVGNLKIIYNDYNPGNPGSWSGLNDLKTFSYDNDDQLLTVDIDPQGQTGCLTWPDCEDQDFTYDNYGNRNSKNGQSFDFAPGSVYLLEDDGEYSYTYDDDGNLITKTHSELGLVTQYSWDEHNRLVSIHFPEGDSVEYVYDYKNRRVKSIEDAGTKVYIYDQFDHLVLEEYRT